MNALEKPFERLMHIRDSYFFVFFLAHGDLDGLQCCVGLRFAYAKPRSMVIACDVWTSLGTLGAHAANDFAFSNTFA